MSWDFSLYAYSLQRGGQYFGCYDEWGGWDGMLVLEYRGEPALVRCNQTSVGRGATTHTAEALLRCTLQRDYALKISPKNAFRQGAKTVFGHLDKGARRLGVDIGLGAFRDYGYPEVTKGRTVSTSDPEFTKMVLRDLELRNALLSQPKFGLLVRECVPRSSEPAPMHAVIAWVGMDMGSDLDLGEPDFWASYEEKLRALGEKNFFEKLDALLALAACARRAVTAWRMPEAKD